VLVLTRYRVPAAGVEDFLAQAREALSALAAAPGHVEGRIGRAADDPDLWLVVTRWTGAGPYRRALSSYDVRARATPLLSRAIDEPTAFELVAEAGGSPGPG
jgi:hypothetical protein